MRKQQASMSRHQEWDKSKQQLYGYFKRQTKDISHEMTGTFQIRENMTREIESMMSWCYW